MLGIAVVVQPSVCVPRGGNSITGFANGNVHSGKEIGFVVVDGLPAVLENVRPSVESHEGNAVCVSVQSNRQHQLLFDVFSIKTVVSILPRTAACCNAKFHDSRMQNFECLLEHRKGIDIFSKTLKEKKQCRVYPNVQVLNLQHSL